MRLARRFLRGTLRQYLLHSRRWRFELINMDFQHRYYRTNKLLLISIGQWPYQTIRTRYGIVVVLFSINIGHVLSQILACVKYRKDKEILLLSILYLIVVAICITKFSCSACNCQKILKLLNRICTDWQVWAQDEEINILHRYADQGRKITLAYAVMVHSNAIPLMTQPIISKVIDVLLKNGSAPGEFSIPVEYYFIDMEKYYFYLTAYSCVCVYVASIIFIALDTIFIVYVLHGCGIFAALGHKLEQVTENHRAADKGRSAFAVMEKNVDLEYLMSCIDRHNEAIEYAKLIEATYTWDFLSVVALNILLISVISLQFIKKTTDFDVIVKYIPFLVVALFHLYIWSYMSQMLTDHSISIRYYIYNCKWYSLSMKAQKIIPLMLMRCNVPCELTAGKIAIMSMRTFQSFANTSMSFFMFLRAS